MSKQPCCGCPLPIINPPDFGAAIRSPLRPRYLAELPWPVDPYLMFPRRLGISSAAWQGTSLGCDLESFAWQPAYPMLRGLPTAPFGVFRNYGLNFASQEIARLLAYLAYPIPGIWIGPVRIHMPSGNVMIQFAVPYNGPLDPVPVYTYNSMASRDSAGRGFGVSDLFNPTVESDGSTTNLVSGTGAYLEYTGVGVDTWGDAPASTRNGLKQLSGGGWLERQPNFLDWYYDSDGFAVGIQDIRGNSWTITRDNDCFVTGITAPGNRATSISGSGGTFAVTQPGSRVTTFTVSNDELTGVTYPGGASYALSYNGEHLLTGITDPAGNNISLSYDSRRRVTSLTVAGGVYQFTYEDNTYAQYDRIIVTDPGSNLTTVSHDCNVVHAVENPLNEITTFAWEGTGDSRLKSIEDALNNKVTLTYERIAYKALALKTIQRPLIGSMTFGYDSTGSCTSVVDYDNNATALSWNAYLERTAVLDAESKRFTFAYNSLSQITEAIDPDAKVVTTNYSSGLATQVVNELTHATDYSYATSGAVDSTTNPLSQTTNFARDAVGRVTLVTDPLSHTKGYEYTGMGQLKKSINGLSKATSFEYDSGYQLSKVTNALGNIDAYAYDTRGNQKSFTNGVGDIVSFTYDAANRRTGQQRPLSILNTFTYDAAGNVLSSENGEGETIAFTYDDAYRQISALAPLSRLTSFSYNNDSLPRGVTNPESETITTSYNGLNQITSVERPLGLTTQTIYDAVHRPMVVVNPKGERTTSVYDAAGQVTAVIEPRGYPGLSSAMTTTVYDVAGRATAVVNAKGKIFTTIFDSAGRPTKVINPLGHAVTMVYDAANRVTAVTNAMNETVAYVYDDADRKTSATDPLGKKTTYQYDGADRLTATIDATGATTETRFDAAGRKTATVNPLSFLTTYGYDKADRQTLLKDAENAVTTYEYDDGGRQTRLIDARGKVTTFQYDLADRITRTTDAFPADTYTEYDDAGRAIRKTAVVSGQNRVTTYVYDQLDRVTTLIDPLGRSWPTAYFASGKVDSEANPLSQATTYAYDALNQLCTLTNARGDVNCYKYDFGNRRTASVDGNGVITTYNYDAADRETEVITPYDDNGTASLRIVTMLYDAAGRKTGTINPKGKLTAYAYDNVGRRTEVTNPLNKTTTYTYDAAGRMSTRKDAKDQMTTYAYDKVDRQTAHYYPGSVSVMQAYDATGNRTQMIDSTGTYTYTYDNVGNLLSQISPVEGVTYDYNQARERTVMGGHDYSYDLNGNVTGLTFANEVTTLSYNLANRLTILRYDNGEVANYVRNEIGKVTLLAVASRTYTYTYDGAANCAASTESDGGYTIEWAYDAVNQLQKDYYIQSGSPINGSATIVYDRAGNRKSRYDPVGSEKTTYTYDDADRLETTEDNGGITTYTYDNNGNRIATIEPNGDITTNTWDAENRLVSVEEPGGDIVTFVYNGDGLMVQRLDGVDQVDVVYDGNNRLRELGPALSAVTEYVCLPGEYAGVISQRRDLGGGMYESHYFHCDGLKNVRLLTNGIQQITDEYWFDAWGNALSNLSMGATPNTQRYKGFFIGYRHEPEAEPEPFYALHYRNYDPSTGDFLSPDPAEDDLNLFRYVRNNPVNKEDPSGLWEWSDNWATQSLYVAGQTISGVGQGALNGLNTLTDTAATAGNLVIGIPNVVAEGVDVLAGTAESRKIRIPYFPQGQWSRGVLTQETDLEHNISSLGVGGGIQILTGVGAAKLAEIPKYANVGTSLLAMDTLEGTSNVAAGSVDVYQSGEVNWTNASQIALGSLSLGGNFANKIGVPSVAPNSSVLRQSGLESLPLARTKGLGTHSTTAELLESDAIPGVQGVVLDQKVVVFSDIWKLSEKAKVEYVLWRENGEYILRSGSPTNVPVKRGVRPIVHTHPPVMGELNVLPSRADINVLNEAWSLNPGGSRPVSQILVGENQTTVFRATGFQELTAPKIKTRPRGIVQ